MVENRYLINSKYFQPTSYLLDIHKQAKYKDLEKGLSVLKASIQHRNDLMKNLVKTHFAKFVSAKSAIDGT
jgi:hypothetical protein